MAQTKPLEVPVTIDVEQLEDVLAAIERAAASLREDLRRICEDHAAR